MKHYKSINKIYYDLIVKDDLDERPFFIMQYEDGYIVFKDMANIIMKFNSFLMAERFINSTYNYPQIIVIDFKQKD